jgi:hypothetical protein
VDYRICCNRFLPHPIHYHSGICASTLIKPVTNIALLS